MVNYEVEKMSMEWWRWNTCIKALKTEKYQPKEGGEKRRKNTFKSEKYRPKEGDNKKNYKK